MKKRILSIIIAGAILVSLITVSALEPEQPVNLECPDCSQPGCIKCEDCGEFECLCECEIFEEPAWAYYDWADYDEAADEIYYAAPMIAMTVPSVMPSAPPSLADGGWRTGNAESGVVFNEPWRYHEMNSNDQFGLASESPFMNALTSPLSTFAASPNTASYSLMRRTIMNNRRIPSAQSIRIEELVNYFSYSYPPPSQATHHVYAIDDALNVLKHLAGVERLTFAQAKLYNLNDSDSAVSIGISEALDVLKYLAGIPGVIDASTAPDSGHHPFSINAEVAACPWNGDNLLAKIAIQGDSLTDEQRLANNVVFLIDVSGSMNSPDRLPLVQQSFIMLLDRLNENDIISIVTYAGGNATLVEGVRATEKELLTNAINGLVASGSTGGSGGIMKAYELAHANFIEGGNNRIILATDGDFNVGVTGTSSLVELVREHKGRGVSLSVLGYGMGNLNDFMMEEIAKAGNGNYAYIDTLAEARKYLVEEFDSMMYTIAKDLKIQVEFNPAVVAEYRLIGYDNRRLNNEDFDNDAVDGGDIGAGFALTAFYELILTDGTPQSNLIYQTPILTDSDDYMNVRIRYKHPDEDVSRLVQKTICAGYYTDMPSDNFQWACAVAEFGLILRQSDFMGNANVDNVITRASRCFTDEFGLRNEFIDILKRYRDLIG
jgi:Ca-activated chloride channel family protein